MQAIGRQHNPPIRAPDGVPVHYERYRPEQTTLYRLVQQHVATFFEQAEAAAGADLPQFVRDEFDAFLECGILASASCACAATTAATSIWSRCWACWRSRRPTPTPCGATHSAPTCEPTSGRHRESAGGGDEDRRSAGQQLNFSFGLVP